MKSEQIALQLYTLRDFCKTVADYAATLKKVKTIGYRAIEIAGMDSIPEKELALIAADQGLVICSTHVDPAAIINEPKRIVEHLELLGCRYAAYPSSRGVDFNDLSQVSLFIKKLDAAGAILRQAGYVLAYHNHAQEFVRLGDGRPALEAIYAGTHAENLQGELDTFWVQAGGGDPVQWCVKLRKRLPLIHLKDYAVNEKGERYYAEIGSGNLNFPAIIAAAEASGAQWFIIEQDHCPGNPLDSIEKSFRFIQDNLLNA